MNLVNLVTSTNLPFILNSQIEIDSRFTTRNSFVSRYSSYYNCVIESRNPLYIPLVDFSLRHYQSLIFHTSHRSSYRSQHSSDVISVLMTSPIFYERIELYWRRIINHFSFTFFQVHWLLYSQILSMSFFNIRSFR